MSTLYELPCGKSYFFNSYGKCKASALNLHRKHCLICKLEPITVTEKVSNQINYSKKANVITNRDKNFNVKTIFRYDKNQEKGLASIFDE